MNQPYKNITIVLVDDGSTDGSGNVCDELAAANNRVTALHQENAGVSAARNTGIEFVLGSSDYDDINHYLAFLDADDLWTSNFFTNESISKLPNATIIRFKSANCNYTVSRYTDTVNVEEGIFEGGDSSVHKCLTSHFGAALYSATLFNNHQIRFIVGLKHSEDVLFLRKCAYRAVSIAFYNRIFYLYRNNPTSCVHTSKLTGFAYFDPMFRAYLAHDFNGVGFVSWYFVDAIEDHFKNRGTVQEARCWMSKHPEYVNIAKEHGGNRAKEMLTALEKHPYLYAGKYRIKGFVFNCVRTLIHLQPFLWLYDTYRYKNNMPANRVIINLE